MIRFADLNPHNYKLTPEQSDNLEQLYKGLTSLIAAGAPMLHVTSGLRSTEDQARINPKAPKSKHLLGAAADIEDYSGELADWVLGHIQELQRAELWCEDVAYTKGWVHFQCLPPKSGKRFFVP